MVLPQNKSHDVVCDCATADINVYFEKVGRRVVHHLREVGRDESIRLQKKNRWNAVDRVVKSTANKPSMPSQLSKVSFPQLVARPRVPIRKTKFVQVNLQRQLVL